MPARAAGTGTIQGLVTNKDGSPVPGATLLLTGQRPPIRAYRPDAIGSGRPEQAPLEDVVRSAADEYLQARANRWEATTEADGAYHFNDLADLEWSVTAYLEGYAFEGQGDNTRISIGSEVDFIATKVLEYPVQVYGPDGQLAEQALLLASVVGERYPQRFAWSPETPFVRLAPQTYTLKAEGGRITNRTIAELASEEQTLKVQEGSTPAALRFDLVQRLAIRGRVRVPRGDPKAKRPTVRLFALAPGEELDLKRMRRAMPKAGCKPGAEFIFTDLKPGLYALGVQTGYTESIVHHQVVEIVNAPVECDLELPPLDRSKMIRATVSGPDGIHLPEVDFRFNAKKVEGSRGNSLDPMPDRGGSFLLPVPEEHLGAYFSRSREAEYSLLVSQGGLGAQEIQLTPGQTEVTISFAAPASLTVTIAGFQGSGLESLLSLTAKGEANDPIARNRAPSAKNTPLSNQGVQTFAGLTPGTHTIELYITHKSQTNLNARTRLVVSKTTIEIRSGENTQRVSIPTLYETTVHWSDGIEGTVMGLIPKNQSVEFSRGQYARLNSEGYAHFQ